MTTQGVEMPVLKYRWRFVLHTLDLDNFNHDISLFLRSMASCSVDYKHKTLTLSLRQGVTGYLHDVVYRLCREHRFSCRIDALSGKSESDVHHSTSFFNCKIRDHNVEYDYSDSEVLTHKIVIKFDSMTLMGVEDEEEK